MRDTLEENVMVSKLIEKIQKTKATDLGRTGSDAWIYSGAREGKSICGVRRDPGRSGRGDLGSLTVRS